MMPSLFISHGSPTVLIEEDSLGRAFLSNLGNDLPRPEAILVISAHWETDAPTLTGATKPDIIYDFYGFPDELYQRTYPVRGSSKLTSKVSELINAETTKTRGLDHGAWAPLSLMYPNADIPVVQLSLQSNRPSSYHYDIGKTLAPLRNEGILIVASGAVTHNLRELEWHQTTPDPWAQDMEDWFAKAVQNNDHDTLLNAENKAPHFTRAHPHPEHWLPLYVAMGAAQNKSTVLHRGFEHKNLSMASVQFD